MFYPHPQNQAPKNPKLFTLYRKIVNPRRDAYPKFEQRLPQP
jgi:hypothetical protein